MSTLLNAETNALIKLDLGEKGGTRRIVFSRLWNSETSQVSFDKLSKMAFEYCALPRPKLQVVNITYIDVDGDTITISTDNELTEAFEQFAVQGPDVQIVIRAKATFKRMWRGDGEPEGRCVKMGKFANLQVLLDSFVTNMTDIVQTQQEPDLLVHKMNASIEKLSKDFELMHPKKSNDVADVDAGMNRAGKPLGRGKGRMNMKTLLDSFVKNMNKVMEGQPAPDELVAKMTHVIEMLSNDIDSIRPQKKDDMVIIDTEVLEAECANDSNKAPRIFNTSPHNVVGKLVRSSNTKPMKTGRNVRNGCNERKRVKMQNERKRVKMQILDSFLVRMTNITEVLKEKAKQNTDEVVAYGVDEMAISSDNDGAAGWEAVP